MIALNVRLSKLPVFCQGFLPALVEFLYKNRNFIGKDSFLRAFGRKRALFAKIFDIMKYNIV
jgi:hypothetical protein